MDAGGGMTRAYRALPGYVIIRELGAPETTAGGLIIPESARSKRPKMWGHEDDDQCWWQRGEVLSVGGPRLFVETWDDPITKEPRSRERWAHPDGIKPGDVVVYGWCGKEIAPGIRRLKLPDVEVVDGRTDEELALVG